MSDSFAKVIDYATRGFDQGEWTNDVLDMRLAAASRWLRSRVRGIDQQIEDGDLDLELVIDVVCTMVARTVPIEELPIGLDSMQITAGPYNQSGRSTNPHGDFYLTKQERVTLGIGGQRAYSVDLIAEA